VLHGARPGILGFCAVVLWILAGLGMVSMIGLFIFPLAIVLFASATLLTVARYESRSA
jgi:hypothetical protein